MNKETSPVCLVVGGKEYPLNDVNEKRVKERLFSLYPPSTIVEEWVDGHKMNEIELEYIFG